MELLYKNSNTIRLFFFVFLTVFFSILEFYFPLRNKIQTRKSRWLTNYSLLILNQLLIKLIIPFSIMEISILLYKNKLGLLNLFPENFSIVVGFLILDLIIYFQHKFFHLNSFFWKLHKVHHIDFDLDTSSGIRFHPLEILFSIFIKLFTIILFGIHPISVIIFEIVLNSMSLFNHSNLKIPKRLNSILEKIIITPSLHLIHHSDNKIQTNSNYGFNFVIWDKLFRTYNKSNINQINIGVKGYQKEQYNSIQKALILPFENKD